MPPAADKRDAILAAARQLILRHGLRGTSMEAIARAAGIAKPTLYAYFKDKPAVFVALVDGEVARWRAAIWPILGAEGDLVERINHVLVEKHRQVLLLLAGTPHADELWNAHSGEAAPRFAAFDADLEAAIATQLAAAGLPRPRFLTQVLLAASAGIARRATTPAELGPAIRLLTERLLRHPAEP